MELFEIFSPGNTNCWTMVVVTPGDIILVFDLAEVAEPVDAVLEDLDSVLADLQLLVVQSEDHAVDGERWTRVFVGVAHCREM